MPPKSAPSYHDLPETVKNRLFRVHEHDENGNIVYREADVIQLLYDLSRPVGIITTGPGVEFKPFNKEPILPPFPPDRYEVHNGITSGECPICHNPAQRKHIFFGKRYCVNPSCDFSKNPITVGNLILHDIRKILHPKTDNSLSEEQIQSVVNWLNTWVQLRSTAIPLRFEETFKARTK